MADERLLASTVLALRFIALVLVLAFTLRALIFLLTATLRFLLLTFRAAGFFPLSFLVPALLLLLNIGLAALCGRATPLLLTDVFSALATLLRIFRSYSWGFGLLSLRVRAL